jgi:hypothetical protein
MFGLEVLRTLMDLIIGHGTLVMLPSIIMANITEILYYGLP